MRVNRVISVVPTARQRRWWVALAIFALAFLSLRPACDLWLSHWSKHEIAHFGVAHAAGAHGHAPANAPDGLPCCATVDQGTLVKSFNAIAWRSWLNDVAPAAPVARTVLRVAVLLSLSLTTSVIPPGNLPFYARSARILR